MSITDELLEHHAAFRAGLQPGCLSRRPAQQVGVLAYRDAHLGVDGILRLRDGDAHVFKDAGGVVSNDKLRLFLSRITDAVCGLVYEVAMGVVGRCWTPRRAIDPKTTEAPKTDRPWRSAPRRRS